MTWSLVALDQASGQLGVAVASTFFAVGAHVPFIASKVGALTTQGLINRYYGIDGLRLLSEGSSPSDVLKILESGDGAHAHRQMQIIDATGRVAAHTGECCLPWSGHSLGDGFSVAGNMLSGRHVIEDTVQAYINNPSLAFARRLVVAMQAGEAAGGDVRGQRSAALIIMADHEWSALDVRVDDHPNPLGELDRLEKVSRKEWIRYRPFVPTRTNPAGVTDHGIIDAAVGSALQEV
jgi:uncharacterized Ntn-hydrolase superfamily protein